MYRIRRFYENAGVRSRLIMTGLTLEEAQAHCSDPETSSATCTSAVGKRRTREIGPWLDGYSDE